MAIPTSPNRCSDGCVSVWCSSVTQSHTVLQAVYIQVTKLSVCAVRGRPEDCRQSDLGGSQSVDCGPADAQKLAVVDVEAYKVKDLWIDLEVMSPVSTAGSYSITVTLYDGGEPVYAAGNLGAVRVQSAFKVWDLPRRT